MSNNAEDAACLLRMQASSITRFLRNTITCVRRVLFKTFTIAGMAISCIFWPTGFTMQRGGVGRNGNANLTRRRRRRRRMTVGAASGLKTKKIAMKHAPLCADKLRGRNKRRHLQTDLGLWLSVYIAGGTAKVPLVEAWRIQKSFVLL